MSDAEKNIVLAAIIGFYLLVLAIGLIFYHYPPKKINGIYGYRTTRSMKNLSNWNYANKISSKYIILSSHATVVILLFLYYLLKDRIAFDGIFLIATALFCLSFLVIIPIVESKLIKFENEQKKRYD